MCNEACLRIPSFGILKPQSMQIRNFFFFSSSFLRVELKFGRWIRFTSGAESMFRSAWRFQLSLPWPPGWFLCLRLLCLFFFFFLILCLGCSKMLQKTIKKKKDYYRKRCKPISGWEKWASSPYRASHINVRTERFEFFIIKCFLIYSLLLFNKCSVTKIKNIYITILSILESK